jgi:hypothetical protein
MPLLMAHRARCDRPGCRYDELCVYATAERARASFARRGWTLIRWRFRLTGGGGRILTLCQIHGDWRPTHGRQFELPAIPSKHRRPSD